MWFGSADTEVPRIGRSYALIGVGTEQSAPSLRLPADTDERTAKSQTGQDKKVRDSAIEFEGRRGRCHFNHVSFILLRYVRIQESTCVDESLHRDELAIRYYDSFTQYHQSPSRRDARLRRDVALVLSKYTTQDLRLKCLIHYKRYIMPVRQPTDSMWNMRFSSKLLLYAAIMQPLDQDAPHANKMHMSTAYFFSLRSHLTTAGLRGLENKLE